MRKILRLLFVLLVAGPLLLASARWIFVRPALDRDWKVEHAVLPTIRFDGSKVHVTDVRSFRYRTSDDFDANYVDRTYDLDRLESVWLVLSPFRENWRGPAHSFLSFGFSDSSYVAISVEARKEKGEVYSVWKGLVHAYELLYVVAEETDLIGLRAVTWHDDVFVYPIKATPDRVRALFVSMMERAAALAATPEFYNTATNNCTTNIYDHVKLLAPDAWGWSWRLLLPGYSDEMAFERGLVDTDLSLEKAREQFRVNERVERWLQDPWFSVRIRDF